MRQRGTIDQSTSCFRSSFSSRPEVPAYDASDAAVPEIDGALVCCTRNHTGRMSNSDNTQRQGRVTVNHLDEEMFLKKRSEWLSITTPWRICSVYLYAPIDAFTSFSSRRATYTRTALSRLGDEWMFQGVGWSNPLVRSQVQALVQQVSE